MKTIFTLLLCITSFTLLSQGNIEKRQERQERIHTLKVGFLTERLDLTSEEAQSFWPIYNKFDTELETLRAKEFEALRSYRKNADDLSDQQAQEILETILNVQETRAARKTTLATNLNKFLTTKKVLALFKAEDDFKRQLLQKLKNRRGGAPIP